VLPYVLSTGAGVFVGLVYGAIGVRSPAPPLIALAGLLGILAGEQAFALWKGGPKDARPVAAVDQK